MPNTTADISAINQVHATFARRDATLLAERVLYSPAALSTAAFQVAERVAFGNATSVDLKLLAFIAARAGVR